LFFFATAADSAAHRSSHSLTHSITLCIFQSIFQVPYFIASTMYVYCDQENNPNFCNGIKIAVASPLAILGFAHSLLNPIIYAWWHTGFRTNATRIYAKRFEKIKCCRWCFNKSNRITSSTATLSVRTTNLSSTSNLSSGITNATSSSSDADADANGITIVAPSGDTR
jgi:hypothetical protein